MPTSTKSTFNAATGAVWFAPVMGVMVGLLSTQTLTWDMAWTLGVTVWVGIWWITEAVPIPVASLVPFVLFPAGGVLSNKEVAGAYGHWLILLLMGGFMLSKMVEGSGLHRRVAIQILSRVGTNSPAKVLLGVMVSTAFLSAWISNTATTLIMLPIVIALTGMMASSRSVEVPMLLGLAYGASIGGMATPIGTPPNLVLLGVLEESTGESIPFLSWMFLAGPIACVLLSATWWILKRRLSSVVTTIELPTLERMTDYERRVLMVFGVVVLLWVTRQQPFGGWSGQFVDTKVGDDTIALLGVVLAFVVPRGIQDKRLLSWDQAVKIPWGLLLLFGGGIAIAKAFMASGLSDFLGTQLLLLQEIPLPLMIVGICLAVTFLTEVTSNTATTTLLMPILVSAGIASGMDPKLWMVPAALSASCAFMLPVATAPNAIVFGSERVPAQEMMRTGFVINLVGVVTISLGSLLLL